VKLRPTYHPNPDEPAEGYWSTEANDTGYTATGLAMLETMVARDGHRIDYGTMLRFGAYDTELAAKLAELREDSP
jgi:hypothetical protein